MIESSGATRDSFIFLINKFGRVNCVTVLLAAPGAISAFLVRGHSRVPFLLCAWGGGWVAGTSEVARTLSSQLSTHLRAGCSTLKTTSIGPNHSHFSLCAVG